MSSLAYIFIVLYLFRYIICIFYYTLFLYTLNMKFTDHLIIHWGEVWIKYCTRHTDVHEINRSVKYLTNIPVSLLHGLSKSPQSWYLACKLQCVYLFLYNEHSYPSDIFILRHSHVVQKVQSASQCVLGGWWSILIFFATNYCIVLEWLPKYCLNYSIWKRVELIFNLWCLVCKLWHLISVRSA